MWTHNLWASSLLAVVTRFNLCPFWSSSISFVCSFVCSSSRSTAGFLSRPYHHVFTNAALCVNDASLKVECCWKGRRRGSQAGQVQTTDIQLKRSSGRRSAHFTSQQFTVTAAHRNEAKWLPDIQRGTLEFCRHRILRATLISATALGIR